MGGDPKESWEEYDENMSTTPGIVQATGTVITPPVAPANPEAVVTENKV